MVEMHLYKYLIVSVYWANMSDDYMKTKNTK
jgi:hypothetical protein